MSRKKSVKREKTPAGQSEIVCGGAGRWVIKDGLFYDPEKRAWIKRCRGCRCVFYAKRRDAKSCSPRCRQRIARVAYEANK